MRVQLHCIARIRVVYLKRVDLFASLMVQSSSRGKPPFLLGPQRKNVGLMPTVHHGRKDSPSRDH
uniref:Ycf15 n=1 Tax=Tinospora cordifolia TaxID=285590 RepID=A0A4D6IYB9_9MAGN|nr:Ycf15 [Tinospora cordifolia]QCC70896.1 Ycf15 [Tinospora cordifolia]